MIGMQATHDLLALSEKQRRATMNIMNRLSRQNTHVNDKPLNPTPPLEECPELEAMADGLAPPGAASANEPQHRRQRSGVQQVGNFGAR